MRASFSKPWTVGSAVHNQNTMHALSHWKRARGGRWHSSWTSVRAPVYWGLALLTLIIVCTAYPAFAQVPRVYGQGAAASGMGNAFAAQADDPSALHYNPAGIAQLRGIQMMGGGSLVGGTTDFRNPSGVTAT